VTRRKGIGRKKRDGDDRRWNRDHSFASWLSMGGGGGGKGGGGGEERKNVLGPFKGFPSFYFCVR